MKTFRLIHKSGARGNLDATIEINANNIIDAGRKASKVVGKRGYHGIYIPQHAEYGWGQWFVVCNLGANATYSVEVIQ